MAILVLGGAGFSDIPLAELSSHSSGYKKEVAI